MDDLNLYRNLNANISPEEFEVFCLEVLKCYAEKQNLTNYTLNHNDTIATYDSTYQIDVYLEFELMGMKYKTICECKKHKENIKRAVVAELYTKLQSTGCQKGVIMSTSSFQKDAIRYALAHGIALWQIADISIKRITNSANYNRTKFERTYYSKLPAYFVLEWDLKNDYPYSEIYPTEEMYSEARELALKDFR